MTGRVLLSGSILILMINLSTSNWTSEKTFSDFLLNMPEIKTLPETFTKIEKFESEARGREVLQSIAGSDVSRRIAYGTPAKADNFLFYGHGIFFRNGGKKSFCGSSLIALQIVLLSTTCFYNKEVYTAQFWFGSDRENLKTYRNGVGWYHPGYSGPLIHDIALYVLQFKLMLSKVIRPISLPNRMTTMWIFDGKILNTVGFGYDENGNVPRYLQYTTLKGISDEQCSTSAGIPQGLNLICAQNTTGNSGVCTDDVGGPLLFEDTLVGVNVIYFASWKCTKTIGGFTRVDRYIDFLESVVKHIQATQNM